MIEYEIGDVIINKYVKDRIKIIKAIGTSQYAVFEGHMYNGIHIYNYYGSYSKNYLERQYKLLFKSTNMFKLLFF